MCFITLLEVNSFKNNRRVVWWIGIFIIFNTITYFLYYNMIYGSADSLSIDAGNLKTLFLIRTYYGHLDPRNVAHLQYTLNSLKSLENPNWAAFLICTDSKPINFEYYTKQDSRILSYPQFEKVLYDEWTAGYDITDKALDYLKNNNFSAKYLVITNGDNYYSPEFLNDLPSTDTIDIVAVDYWSRYQQEGNYLHPLNTSLTKCNKAIIRVGKVDLGGVLLNYQKFQEDRLRFMKFGSINSQDGFMFQLLLQKRWIQYIRKCLFSHSPNPYMCNEQGGVWWDSPISRKELGDGCMNEEQRLKKKSELPIIELVSSTGIKYWTVPEPLRSERKKLAEAESTEFRNKYSAKLRESSKNLCDSLKKSRYQLDIKSYASSNADLAAAFKTDKEFIDHFWNSGYYEIRPIGNIDISYYGK